MRYLRVPLEGARVLLVVRVPQFEKGWCIEYTTIDVSF